MGRGPSPGQPQPSGSHGAKVAGYRWRVILRALYFLYYNVPMAKTEPFSMRLSARLSALIAEEARRTRRSKGAVIETLADEALRCRRFPGIAFRGDDWNRRAWVIGTGLDVWELIQALQDFGSPERVIAETDLSERQVETALAYYREYPEEVDRAVDENRRSIEALRREFPTIGLSEVPD